MIDIPQAKYRAVTFLENGQRVGQWLNKGRYSLIYRANVYVYDGSRAYWGKLSSHRKLKAAIAACEAHARKDENENHEPLRRTHRSRNTD